MNRKFVLAGLALALSAGLSTAAAQGPGGPRPSGKGPGAFGLLEFDANGDGKLTRAEFDAGQKARFDRIDADKDGTATREEMRANMQAMRAEAQKARFASLDKDGDGKLSEAEAKAGMEDGGRPGPGFGPGPGRGPRPDGGPRGGRQGAGAGDDGKLTFAEFTARPNELFARADANKDAVVTVAELQALKPAGR